MRDIKLARALLDSAKRDIFSLRSTVDIPDYPEEVFGFHVQQTAEKSFKAWLALFNELFPYTGSNKDEPLERNTALRLSEELVKHVETMSEGMEENR